MRYEIQGADRDTGEPIEMTIDAASEQAAQDVANRRGILVSSVSPEIVRIPAPITHASPQYRNRIEQGHYAGAPVVNVALPRRGSSLGIASLVLGILAFLICWIPIVNIIGIPLAALGALLGVMGLIVALTRSGSGIGFPIAGTAICALALLVAISINTAIFGGINRAQQALESAKKEAESRRVASVPASEAAASPVRTRTSSESPPPVPSKTPAPFHPVESEERAIEWAAMDSPVRNGDIQIRVKWVRIGLVPLARSGGRSGGTSKDSLLQIALELSNVSETKKADYRSWGADIPTFGDHMSLRDNFGNSYKHVTFGYSTTVEGATDHDSIYPGKALSDVLVFEAPIAKAEYLNLELPAKQFGGIDMVRIRIPVTKIDK